MENEHYEIISNNVASPTAAAAVAIVGKSHRNNVIGEIYGVDSYK